MSKGDVVDLARRLVLQHEEVSVNADEVLAGPRLVWATVSTLFFLLIRWI